MNFYQLATKNVARNLRSYLAFYLSSSFAVMIFYIFAMFIFHPALETGVINTIARKGMIAAEWIIFVFSILFVLYSVNAFLHTRKKEFGILTISGTSPKQLRRLVTLENLVIGLASIISGIAGGTILAKMFFVAGGYILDMDELSLYLPWKAIGLTSGVFLVLFFIISQFTLFFINTEETVALLKGSIKPKKAPKPSILLSALALIFLGTGYTMAFIAEINMTSAVIILILTVIGTFFFYSQLSVWILKRLKKSKNLYLNGYHFLTISDLTYRLKDNARLFFIVSIVSAVAFTATGVLTVFKSKQPIEKTNYEIEYLSSPDNGNEAKHIGLIEESLSHVGIDYKAGKVEALEARYQMPDGTVPVIVILSQKEASKYNPTLKVGAINDGEAIVYLDNRGFDHKKDIPSTLKIVDSPYSLKVKGIESSILGVSTAVVVNEQTYKKMKSTFEPSTLYGFHFKDWKKSVEISKILHDTLYGNYTNIHFEFFSKGLIYYESVQIPSLSLFIGLFVALVFFLAAGSFIYFRLFTDLEHEQEKYKALSKVGLTEMEIKKSATWQLLILFFLPFIVAIVHTCFALKVLERDMGSSVVVPTIITIIGFLILEIVYFTIVRISYVKKIMASIDE
ncbi:FtsX-like permease family protein [Heyndrickxia oleronia]|uniref:Peptide ABC transporter permease n=1 Tax=Heyndrickxia oleronia TaxID=38875 RepID=A0A8E2IA29_9BACI|nr:ABC transporter permease [Heyndrickxia oleronia]MCI1589063.1 ABC transporter permease [Heyndrickxia oleronia]MCI1611845.1 ABC transporter permease [Heyndrickxia oleronia]MCI1743148.1 ABC transporter permease [Heyndrickxia oleronia]MCI1759643.1 ABC transporter permease [Heyndrickxia oleronia]MEC1375947.1 ABC transporter permease [Heyndrickxia oleronia]